MLAFILSVISAIASVVLMGALLIIAFCLTRDITDPPDRS